MIINYTHKNLIFLVGCFDEIYKRKSLKRGYRTLIWINFNLEKNKTNEVFFLVPYFRCVFFYSFASKLDLVSNI